MARGSIVKRSSGNYAIVYSKPRRRFSVTRKVGGRKGKRSSEASAVRQLTLSDWEEAQKVGSSDGSRDGRTDLAELAAALAPRLADELSARVADDRLRKNVLLSPERRVQRLLQARGKRDRGHA
jgi:hypothetical protein